MLDEEKANLKKEMDLAAKLQKEALDKEQQQKAEQKKSQHDEKK